MSVTPSHKYHDAKKNKLFSETQNNTMPNTLLKTSTHRGKSDLTANNGFGEVPLYKNNMAIEEVKDEYNDSKLSFKPNDENEEYKVCTKTELDIDLEAMILVEDKICALSSHVVNDYWDVSNEVYNHINEQFSLLAGELKHIKTVKTSLILEYIVVIICCLFSDDSKTHKGTSQQIKNLNYYIHQNILLLIDVIIDKLSPKEDKKEWIANLKSIIESKLSQMSVKTTGLNNKKQPKLDIISQNCESIIPLVKNIVSKKPIPAIKKGKKSLTQTILHVLKTLDSHSFLKLREMLHKAYNSHMKRPKGVKKAHQLPPLCYVGGTALQPMAPLPKVKAPYLPDNKSGKDYTLVLDLDETLVHYFETNGKGKYNIRPSCHKFLREMAEYYEVVIFTAAMQDYADWVLNEIDKKKYISHRLYRQHATPYGLVFVKDLSKLGRDLSKVIIVDNVAENFQLQPDNGIFIKSWFEDPKDTALTELAPLLKEIVVKKCDDVRAALRKFRDQMIEQISKGITNPKLSLD